MSLFEVKQPGPVHHAAVWLTMIAGLGWALSQCAGPSTSQSKPAPPQNVGGLDRIRVGSSTYRKEGFGSVLSASFAIYNDNDYAIKDVTVTCHGFGPSGTLIDRNSRAVYKRINARGYFYLAEVNMGFVSPQATRFACVPMSFSRA